MRIFVLGNINSGKTFVVKKLKKMFSNYKIISIDEYRRKYSDGSIDKESITRSIFAKDIIKYEDSIIEFSGGKTISSLFIDDLRINSFVVLEVIEDAKVCIERIKGKDFNEIPYPKFTESLEDTIYRLDKEFKSGAIKENFLDKYLIKYEITSTDKIENFPLKQYENAIKIADNFMGKCECLIAYGSLGRGDMNINSDIDLFMLTNMEVNSIKRKLEKLFHEAEFLIQNNQIDVFSRKQLIEITIVSDINDIQLYYVKSEIKNTNKTLLLGYKEFKQKLRGLINGFEYDFVSEFNYTLYRLEYFSRSLERIIRKKDDYKYFFHSNIIIHEFIKLKYFMRDKREYSYLPKKAFDYIEEEVFHQLLYTPDKNQKEHCNIVSTLVKKIIKEANNYKANLIKDL